MPTTNPVPSTDPTDLLFNAGKLDEVVNGTANSFTDRLGVSRRTVAGMNADFDAQLADAESDLNVYRADAAASAAEALGYLQTIRATSYGAYASDPATDPLGNPPTVGDEYFNTTANLLKRWNGTTWQASDINTANLAASSGSSLVGYDTGTVQDVLDTISVYSDSGTASNIIVAAPDSVLQNKMPFYVKVKNNSAEGVTLNGKPVKILDIYATEQSQWTIVNGSDASKDKPKANVYRRVYMNMLSEDVEYKFLYNSLGDFYEVFVPRLYKHVFIGTGLGAEIFELQDVFGFISQFDRGSAMDPVFMRVDANTDYYPNKAQITITLPSGTVAGGSVPVVSQFSKQVRIGENSLNGIEIVNETRYSSNQPASLCIAEYIGTLGADDLAFLNIWKTDLGEIRGIRWKYAGTFTANSQSVIRYNRSYARLKLSEVDVSQATVNAGVTAVSAVYWDGENECFDNKVICNPTTEQDLAAYYTGQNASVAPGLLVSGRPKYAFRTNGPLTVSNCQVLDPVSFLVDVFGPSYLTFTGASTNLSGITGIANYNGHPVTITTASGLTTFAALAPYVGHTFTFGDKIGVSSTIVPTFVVDHPTGGAKLAIGIAGVSKGGVGHFASVDGLELSGDGSARHAKITTAGNFEAGSDNAYSMGTAGKRWSQVYAATGTINTSDEREKQDIANLDSAEIRVAARLKGLVKKFRFKDAVLEKGDGARIHVGVIAQEVIAAFNSEGLDPARYGIICHNQWEAEIGIDGIVLQDSGERYGVRYEELFAFIIAAL